MTNHQLVPFRTQRAIFVFFVAGLIALYTLSVQWSHVELAGLSAQYVPLIKIGLISDVVIIMFLLVWELYARHKSLTLACFAGVFVIEVVCIIHAGAILQLDTGNANNQKATTQAIEAQIKMAAEIERARVESLTAGVQTLNQAGQTKSAARMARNTGTSIITPQISLPAVDTKHRSFLPEWYLNGPQYFVTILLAYMIFAVVFFVSRTAVETEDVPLVANPERQSIATGGTQPTTLALPQRAVGFNSGNFTTPSTSRENDPKA